MEIQPLPRALFDAALALDIATIQLSFSGGSDEGYLDIECCNANGRSVFDSLLNERLESWVWRVYEYSGAGDGNSYGDDVLYDLKKKTVTASVWTMVRQDGKGLSGALRLSDDTSDED
jgi:hypothetical protein